MTIAKTENPANPSSDEEAPKGARQFNFALTQESRQCLEDLKRIMDLSASAVINQALQRLRLSDEVRQFEAVKAEVLGLRKK